MPKFKCTYKECQNFGKPVTFSKASFMFDEKQKKMVLRGEYRCPLCHNNMEFISEEGDSAIHGFVINKFGSLTPEQKRSEMKKRSQEHFKRTDKGSLNSYKQQIINDNKRMVGGF